MSNLESQLASVFKAGLSADPKAAAGLAASLSKFSNAGQEGVTKAEANYHTDHQGDKSCGDCQHFSSPSSCEIVSGHVSADGTCDYYSSGGGSQSDSTNDSEPDPSDSNEGAENESES